MTNVITGKNLSLTIDGDSYDAQAESAVLKLENNTIEIQTLGGLVYKTIQTTGSLTVTLWQDFGSVPSLSQALWDAAKTAPDTGLAFTLTETDSGKDYTGYVLPKYPEVGGTAPEALKATVELTIVDGDVTAV